SPGREAPLPGGFDRLGIEAEGRVERADDLHVADRAVLLDDALEKNGPLHFGAHRVGGVRRLHFAEHARQHDAVARPIDAAAGPPAAARPEAGSGAGADAAAGPRPRAAAAARSL